MYDAILIVSFGGPEGMDDVIPFLENVLRGKNVPRERMLAVAHHYGMVGGISPINEQNRKLIAALQIELKSNGPHLPIYWGNRNWHPMLADTIKQMAQDGVKKAIAFVTSVYGSYSSCRQYLEDIERARLAVGSLAPQIDKLRTYYNHPGFIKANQENLALAMKQIPESRQNNLNIVFTAHSIPESMAVNCNYQKQLMEACRLTAGEHHKWQLVFQSRSGPPSQNWLEPDICDHLKMLHNSGETDAVVLPIGFISDHMEVVYDLDTQAQNLCQEIGLNMVRAATVGVHPAFISMIRELILERIDSDLERKALGAMGVSHDYCPANCCIAQVSV